MLKSISIKSFMSFFSLFSNILAKKNLVILVENSCHPMQHIVGMLKFRYPNFIYYILYRYHIYITFNANKLEFL